MSEVVRLFLNPKAKKEESRFEDLRGTDGVNGKDGLFTSSFLRDSQKDSK